MSRQRFTTCLVLWSAAWLSAATLATADELATLLERGELAQAEALLRTQVADPLGPVVGDAARQLEILRRTRLEYSLDRDQLLVALRSRLPDVTDEQIDRWTAAGALQHRVIDGQVRYFRKAPNNLFLIEPAARGRRDATNAKRPPDEARERFDLDALLGEIVDQSQTEPTKRLTAIRHRLEYEVRINGTHPRVKPRLRPGAVVRAWLPFPQEYGPQTEVRLVSSEPPVKLIAPNGVPHRSAYFEQTLGASESEAPTFQMTVEFVSQAYCPRIDPDQVQPYDPADENYRRYTAERLPHEALTPAVRRLADEIVGDQTNPLEKARRVFRWVSANILWVGEYEYCLIPSLSQKGLAEGRGDCGVQGTVFVTLCRAAGVPARWQSGWETQPGRWNLHDWSEIYVLPWGWLPVDASYGVRKSDDPRVADFYLGARDPYRMIVNLDYARELIPPKTSFRSEPNDFQRGEVEIDGHNLYFDEWTYRFDFRTEALDSASTP
ncbi:transglutaminase-like domain-containing protein [Botrimarina hoheduenensis]|uniref:Transglutaminase-like superfamily protein n=1 Tax=Botrimarina hoheduenensis TaxID=2528000 RepID=A0A5C5VXL2_9BACT|nr:transglutaminase-like domain-containing protein [Botrimarina hoheduenensis]TWT42451.1 Transglutaminase-like superfamily protein [Botrimarina hoheduenensis]